MTGCWIGAFCLCVLSLGMSSQRAVYAQEQAPNLDKSLDSVELNVLGEKHPQLPTETRIELLEHHLQSAPTPSCQLSVPG